MGENRGELENSKPPASEAAFVSLPTPTNNSKEREGSLLEIARKKEYNPW